MNLNLQNLNYSHLGKIFAKNFLLGGVVLGSFIAIIEIIYHSTNLLNFYAFICASFFLYEIPQYLAVRNKNKNLSFHYLKHSVYGSFIFFVFTALLFYLHAKDYKKKHIIYITCILYIIIAILYFIYQMYYN